jgi:hypothetical protein
MLAGHYSAAFLAKAVEPRVPLWLLMLAAQLTDIVWACLVLLGVEHLRVDPSLASNPLDLYDMPYTHSLVGTLVWAALAYAIVKQWLGSRRAALVTSATVLSHWVLDLVVHRPDLTLWGSAPKLGLSVWEHPRLALALELGLLLGSAWIYVRVQGIPPAGRRGVALLTAALAVVQLSTAFAPPPLGPTGVAITALLLFFATAWGALRVERAIDRRAAAKGA